MIQQIKQALHLVHDWQSPPETRNASQRFCEEVKNKDPNSFRYGLQLVSTENQMIERHFGFQLLEHIIKVYWNNLQENDKAEIKKGSLELFMKTKDLLSEEQFIREKASNLILEIVKRDWPQKWPNLFQNLTSLCSMGDTQAELVLLTLQKISDEVKSDYDVPDKRKRDILQGLENELHGLFTFFYNYLENQYNLHLQSKDSKIHILLVNRVLTTLSSFISWAPISSISDMHFPEIFCQLLPNYHFRMISAENLLIFIQRKGKPEDKYRVLTVFQYMDIFSNSISTSCGDPEQDFIFHKKLGEILSNLGIAHLSLLSKDKYPPNYEKFFELMLIFSSHPSFILSCSIILPFWITLFNNYTITSQIFPNSYARILKQFVIKLNKFNPFDAPNGSSIKYFAKSDFESKENFNLEIHKIQLKLKEAFLILCPNYIELILDFLISHFNVALQSFDGNSEEMNISGLLAAIVSLFSFIQTRNQEEFFQKHPKVIQSLEQLLLYLLNYNPSDFKHMTHLLKALKSFIQIFKLNLSNMNEVITLIINKFLKILETFPVPEGDSENAQNAIRIRRKACTSLLALGLTVPEKLLQHLSALTRKSQEIYSSLLLSERVYFIEFLVCISNTISEQIPFLNEIIEPFLTSWSSPNGNITLTLSSPTNIFSLLQIFNVTAEQEEIAKQILFHLNVFVVVWRRSKIPMVESHIKAILSNVLNIIRAIHLFWNPNFRSQFASSIPKEVFAIDDNIKAPLLGTNYSKKGNDKVPFLRNWLQCVRDDSYLLMSYATKNPQFYYIENFEHFILSPILENLEYLEARHLKLMLRHLFVYFLKYSPIEMLFRFNSFLQKLFLVIFNTLNASWTRLSDSENINQDSEENEIIEDKVTRDLAREYCLSVKILLDEPKHLKGIHQTPLHSYLFTSDLFSKTVAYTILGCIQWPDSQANRKALGLGVSFIQTVVKQGKDSLYNVAGELLFLAIRGLLFPHLKELQNEVLTLIREGYILLVSVSQIPQTIFASIGMKPNEIETFHKQFMSSEDEKKQKITLKSFLLKFFEARDQSKLTKPSILDLQERVFKPEKPEKPSWGDFEENGIQNLFNNN